MIKKIFYILLVIYLISSIFCIYKFCLINLKIFTYLNDLNDRVSELQADELIHWKLNANTH